MGRPLVNRETGKEGEEGGEWSNPLWTWAGAGAGGAWQPCRTNKPKRIED